MRQMRQMRPDLETVAEGLVNLFRHFLAELSGAKIPLIHPTSRYIFKLWSGPTACSTMFSFQAMKVTLRPLACAGVVMCLAGDLLRKYSMLNAGRSFNHIVQVTC